MRLCKGDLIYFDARDVGLADQPQYMRRKVCAVAHDGSPMCHVKGAYLAIPLNVIQRALPRGYEWRPMK